MSPRRSSGRIRVHMERRSGKCHTEKRAGLRTARPRNRIAGPSGHVAGRAVVATARSEYRRFAVKTPGAIAGLLIAVVVLLVAIAAALGWAVGNQTASKTKTVTASAQTTMAAPAGHRGAPVSVEALLRLSLLRGARRQGCSAARRHARPHVGS